MNKTIHFLLSIFCFLLAPFWCTSQSLLEKTILKIGIAKSEVDTRESPKQFREKHTLDDEYFINITFQQPIFKKLQIMAGVGYSLSVNDYSLYIENIYFGRFEQDLHTVGTYYKHQLQPNLAVTYSILEKKKLIYSIGLLWNYNLYINKSIRNGHDKFTFSKSLFQPSLMEVYPTISGQYKRFSVELAYRIFNKNYADNAIRSYTATGDNYNPIKLRCTVGYRLK